MVACMTTLPAADLAISKFLRTLSAAALELAATLESATFRESDSDLSDLGLGELQRAVCGLLSDAPSDSGLSPRELTKALKREDEPNIRQTLNRLAHRGVVELLPGPTHRWRLTAQYASLYA